MEMFLMLAAMSFLAILVTFGLFASAMGTRTERTEVRAAQGVPLTPPRFFLEAGAPVSAPPRVPLEVLLLQIERHVRLEQAAAESFIDAPTAQSLHSRTTSPLIVH